MRNFIRKLALFILFISPVSLWAHEGHGIVEHGPAHYLLSPEHSILIAIVIFGLIILISRIFVKKTN